MISRYSVLPLVLPAIALLLPVGCTVDPASGGNGLIPVNQPDGTEDDAGGGGGPSVLTPGGGTGDTDVGGAEDGDGGDVNTDGEVGTNGDVSTDGGAGEDDASTNGDGDGGDDVPPGSTPPTVVLYASPLTPSVGQTLFLTCTVMDSGGSPPTEYTFESSAGSSFIVQDGGAIASVEVPASPLTVNYWCQASNAAGQGEPSPIVTVTVIGGGF